MYNRYTKGRKYHLKRMYRNKLEMYLLDLAKLKQDLRNYSTTRDLISMFENLNVNDRIVRFIDYDKLCIEFSNASLNCCK